MHKLDIPPSTRTVERQQMAVQIFNPTKSDVIACMQKVRAGGAANMGQGVKLEGDTLKSAVAASGCEFPL